MVRPCPCLLVICLPSLDAELVNEVPSESKEEDYDRSMVNITESDVIGREKTNGVIENGILSARIVVDVNGNLCVVYKAKS